MIRSSLKRFAAVSLAAATALTLVAGCSKGGQSSSSGGTITLWTHNAGNVTELAAINAIVKDFNASQKDYTVKVQAFPQTSYNQSIVAAAASGKLPCIMDIDSPNVPDWAWAKYLAPLTGMDDTLSKYLPSVVGKWNGQTYSFGFYDVALAMFARKSVLTANNIRIPDINKPWTADEFAAALKTLKASGKFQYALDMQTASTGEWWPYAYSPQLQSFGGDLINRSDYKSAAGALNGDAAIKWATWFRSLITDGYTAQKSGSDSLADFLAGKTAILWDGSWAADQARTKLAADLVTFPPPDFGSGPKIGGGSWQWGMSATCSNSAGALAYLKFSSADKYVAQVATATGTIPATDAAAATMPGFKEGGPDQIFRQYSQKFALIRPPTPGYPFIATEFTKTAQDILAGADPKKELDQAVSDIDANLKANGFYAPTT